MAAVGEAGVPEEVMGMAGMTVVVAMRASVVTIMAAAVMSVVVVQGETALVEMSGAFVQAVARWSVVARGASRAVVAAIQVAVIIVAEAAVVVVEVEEEEKSGKSGVVAEEAGDTEGVVVVTAVAAVVARLTEKAVFEAVAGVVGDLGSCSQPMESG